MAIVNQDMAVLRSALRIIDEQRRAKREGVRKAVKTASVPMPPEVVQALSELNPSDARDVLRDHPGFSIWERRRSYETSLSVFESSVEDLLSAIQHFEEASRDGTIFNRAREEELNRIERAVQKELFAAANAAHALVDHSTRRFQTSVQVPDYTEWLQERFKNDGLHEFVIGLRTILHHIHMLRPGWQVRHGFGEEGHEASFKLDREEVRLAVEQADSFSGGRLNRIREYLSDAPEQIDLRQVFEEYRRRAAAFHSWFSDSVEAQPLEELRDYERCMRENKNFATRTWWRAMLGNWLNCDQPPNPYDHLNRYLAPEQLEEVYRLPKASHEQVDKIIEFVDIDGACDDELRQLAYELFDRSKP